MFFFFNWETPKCHSQGVEECGSHSTAAPALRATQECRTWWNCRGKWKVSYNKHHVVLGRAWPGLLPVWEDDPARGRVQCWLISTGAAHWNHSSLPQISSLTQISGGSHTTVFTRFHRKEKSKQSWLMTNSEIFYTKLVQNQNQNKRIV